MLETDVAKKMKAVYASLGWDVEEELVVDLTQAGRVSQRKPDLVVIRDDVIGVCETKGDVALTPKVVNQAQTWLAFAHYVSLAMPHPGFTPSEQHKLMVKLVKSLGIGLTYIVGVATERIVKARRNRRIDERPIMDAIAARHRAGPGGVTVPAGSPGGLRQDRRQDRFNAVRVVLKAAGRPLTSDQIWHELPLDYRMSWPDLKSFRREFFTNYNKGLLGIVRDDTKAPWEFSFVETEDA